MNVHFNETHQTSDFPGQILLIFKTGLQIEGYLFLVLVKELLACRVFTPFVKNMQGLE